ncbi:uncharacterized protein LOC111472902 [Cucurbita maxima]|uniref:Uncharacterized protein LOC111472902 n=1 Tax=Cucurbita maxima TaxID=3661 RepID=A0A6J1I9T5_CUCMA|nr:uncharacterized protein LOC111472902 [Cucurbita maxima]
MLMFSTATSSQIRFLLQSLTESNAESVLKELYEFIDCGTEGSFILLRTCLDYFTIHGTDLENPLLRLVISSVFKHLLDIPNFSTIFCESLKGRDINQVILENISNLLNLSMCERIGVGLAVSDSENLDARMCGKNFCISQIEELCANAVSVDSIQQIQDIIMFLQRSEGLSKHLDSFMQMLSLVQLKDVTEFVLSPLLSDALREEKFLRNVNLSQESLDNDFDSILAEMEKEMSMGDIMKELGYGCTVNATQCKEILSLFLPLTEITISKILGMIVRNHTGLEDSRNIYTTFSLALGCSTLSDLPSLNSWDVDVLIDTVKQLAPSVDWIRVMENLDHEGFYIPNEEAFSFFMSVYRRACQEAFPLHTICGSVWKNMEGQISFLKHAVFAPPEIFTFAHSGRQLAYIDGVHGHKLQLGHTNHTWTCLDLLNILCELAERGHARSVQSILEFPLKNWPELLLFGMAHINFIDCGTEGSFILLRTCLDYFTIHGTDLENPLLRLVISSVFKHLLDIPNFSTIFCESLKGRDINQVILENISNLLNLSMCERIGVGLAVSDSENLDARMCGKNFCISQIEELCANAVSVDSIQQIQDIIMFLQRSEGLSKHLDSFMQMLSLVQLKDVTEFVLSPLLSDALREEKFLRNVNLSQESLDNDFDSILAEMEKEMSMGDIMKELGYGCTVNATQCKEILSLFLPLTEITISKILGMIVRNHTGLEDSRNIYTTFSLALGCSTLSDLPSLNSWDVDVLIDTVKQLAPSVDWIRVMENLDHEGFYIPNEEAFSFFMSVYRRACQEAFPLHTICGSVWKNMEGQISFLKHAVFAPPEIFTFAHSGRQLAYIDGVHGHKLQLGHTNHTWTCLDLLNILCELAERGHARSVQSILEFPLKNWPELLLFGMAHINVHFFLSPLH